MFIIYQLVVVRETTLRVRVNSIKAVILFLCINCFASNLQAQQKELGTGLANIEHWVHNNPKHAAVQLNALASNLKTIGTNDRIKWLIFSLQTSRFLGDKLNAEDFIINKLPLVLQGLTEPEQSLWSTILTINIKISAQQKFDALSELKALQKRVEALPLSFLKAFYYKSVYLAAIEQRLYDIAMDTAILNSKQWQQLDEPYFALEMAFRLLEFRVGMLNVANSDQLIHSFKAQANTLEVTRYHIPLTELEADLLAKSGQFELAYQQLSALISNGTLTAELPRFIYVTQMLASYSLRLNNFTQAKQHAKDLMQHVPDEDHPMYPVAAILLSKALIELNQFEQVNSLISQAVAGFSKHNDQFGLFEVELANIKLYYKMNDIEKLYAATMTMVDKLNSSPEQQEQEYSARIFERALRAASADEHEETARQLKIDNLYKQQKLQFSNRLHEIKNHYIWIISIICVVLIIVFFWLFYLLKKVRRLANTDSLTGINNRRRGLEKTERILMQVRQNRQKGAVAIAMMDLDHFKQINDNFGHETGDEVIKMAVKNARNMLGDQDVICRMGGEEFLIVLKDKSELEIEQLIDEIRQKINGENYQGLGLEQPVSASIGLCFVRPTANLKQLKDYIIEADTALYHAKHNGRNQVKIFSDVT